MISIVVPTFNSNKSLFELVHRIKKTFQAEELFEILIIDDGSALMTWTTIQKFAWKISLSEESG